MSVLFEDVNYLTESHAVSNETENDLFLLSTSAKEYYGSLTAKSMYSVIIEIEYRSLFRVDEETYFLSYCEKFNKNNVTDNGTINEYE